MCSLLLPRFVIFTSDNGYHLGQHRMAGGKQSPYDEDIHLPLFIRGPGVPAGVSIPHLVANSAPPYAAGDRGAAASPFAREWSNNRCVNFFHFPTISRAAHTRGPRRDPRLAPASPRS